MLGNFNLPYYDWSIPCTTNVVPSHSISLNFLHEQGLFQLNLHSTRVNNIIDLVITNASDRILNLTVNLSFNISDHDSVSFSLYIPYQPNISNVPNTVIYEFSRADFVTIKRLLQLTNRNS